MSEKDLQRLTNSVDYVDYRPILRRTHPARRNHITQKVKITDQRTLYISVHEDDQPAMVLE